MANLRGDVENQLIQEGEEEDTNVGMPAWFDHTGTSVVVIVLVGGGFLLNLLEGKFFIANQNTHITTAFVFILTLLFISSLGLESFKLETSGLKKLGHTQKIILMVLNLFPKAILMVANVLFLAMIDKYYLPFAVVPILGFTLVVWLFYLEIEPDQDQVEEGHNENYESMVQIKNAFKAANFTSTVGFAVQTAVGIYCLKHEVAQYSPMIVAFFASVLGSLASTITSSPLQFQSSRMCFLLEQIPRVMVVLQVLVAAFVSAKFLDPLELTFAVFIPSILMFAVHLCPNSFEKKVAEVDSMFEEPAKWGFLILSAIYYPLEFETKGSSAILTCSVMFLLEATISFSIRMAFFRPTCTVIGRINDYLPIVLIRVGAVLLVIELLYTHNTSIATAPVPSPH